jgi:hypothetical protein
MVEVRVTELLRCPYYRPFDLMDEYRIRGQITHAILQTSKEFERCEKEKELRVEIDKEIVLIGHVDILCDDIIFEIKPYPSLDEQRKLFTRQIQIYANMYNRIYGKIPKMFLIYYKWSLGITKYVKQEVFYEDVWDWVTKWAKDYVKLNKSGKLLIKTYLCSTCLSKNECYLYMFMPEEKILYLPKPKI